jgi:hypothetical protein
MEKMSKNGVKAKNQPAAFRGGYADRQTQPETFYVSFSGNGYTSRSIYRAL